MFADANKIASQFTRPVLFATELPDGKLGGGIGAFVVVNDEGWIVTAFHQIQEAQNLSTYKQDYDAYITQVDAIRKSPEKMSDSERNKRIRRIKAPEKAVKQWAMKWGFDADLTSIAALPDVDLAAGKLDPFDPAWITTYPVFKDPSLDVHCGRSLCRLGYPFHDVKPTLDTAGHFIIDTTPPFFASEGIYSRNHQVGTHPSGYPLLFLETSSPGLRGQSGGPVFDTKGTIWAIQSRTVHYPLGFSPPVPGGKKGEREHQFLNVGQGIHVATLLPFFDERKIRYQKSTY